MPKRTESGRWLNDDEAVIIFRNTGQVINHASIVDKTFKIDTPDLGTLTFKTAQLKSIVFKNLPTYPTDVLHTLSGSEFNGTIENDPITVDAEDLGGRVQIASSKIVSIIW